MNELQAAFLEVLIELDKIANKHKINYSLYAGSLLGAVRHKGFIPWDDDIDIILSRNDYNKLIAVLNDKSNLKDGYYLQDYENNKAYMNTTPKLRCNKLSVLEKLPKHFDQSKGAWVDIFVFDNVPDDEVERKRFYKKLKRIDNILLTFVYAQADVNGSGLKNAIKRILEKTTAILHPLYFFIDPLIKKRIKLAQAYNNIETSQQGVNSYNYYVDYAEFQANIIDSKYLSKFTHYPFEDYSFMGYQDYDQILTCFYGDYMTPLDMNQRTGHNISINNGLI